MWRGDFSKGEKAEIGQSGLEVRSPLAQFSVPSFFCASPDSMALRLVRQQLA